MHGSGHRHHHDHDLHAREHDHAHDGDVTMGHNRPKRTAQWQVPHLPEGMAEVRDENRDLDLVEASFAEGFSAAGDPTSFLRLARIPFVGTDADGQTFHLLRVLVENLADVGSVVPLLGGEGVRYDPLPGSLASRRRRLSFIYHDGTDVRSLNFAEARALTDRSGTTRFEPAPRT